MMAKETVDIKETARLLKLTERHVRRMCIAGRLNGAARNGKGWEIPRTAHTLLWGIKRPDDLSREVDLADVSAKKQTEAIRRLGIVKECEKFCGEAVRNNMNRSEAMAAFATQKNIGYQTIYRWLKEYRTRGLEGLIDGRGGAKFTSEIISPEAWGKFCSDYLTPRQLTVKTCWQNVCYINKSEDKGWKVPGLQCMYKYVERNIPLPVAVLHREGLAAYEARCAPYIMTDPDSIEPGAVWVGDHHQCNCWVRHRNRWVRPWITAWQDMRSRTAVGWYISAAPNQTTIMLAMKRAIEQYGPPDSVKIDNGKDYDSEMFTGTTKVKRRVLAKGYIDTENVAGIYATMDISVSFAQPYHPQAKSIERWFDTLDVQFTKTMPTYCGKDSARKPEDLVGYLKSDKAIADAMSLDEFAETIGQYINVYNRSGHTGRGMDGATPLQVFARRQSRRMLAAGVLELLMRVWSGELTVGKNGVRFKGLYFGQFDTELMKYQGKKVRVSYDPDNIQQLYVYEANTYRLITIADQAQLVAYEVGADEESLRHAKAAQARAKKIVKQYRPAARTANTDLTSLTIAAMADRARETGPLQSKPALRPVATAMDGQVGIHQKLINQKAVRKAAGAEGTGYVPDLQIDYAGMRPVDEVPDISLTFDIADKKTEAGEGIKLRLFNDG